MQVQLIQGHFNKEDAAQILSEMIKVKINFHENKITKESSEEIIKFREKKIRLLQNELSSLNEFFKKSDGNISLNANINID